MLPKSVIDGHFTVTPTVTFPASGHYCPLTGFTVLHGDRGKGCEQLAHTVVTGLRLRVEPMTC